MSLCAGVQQSRLQQEWPDRAARGRGSSAAAVQHRQQASARYCNLASDPGNLAHVHLSRNDDACATQQLPRIVSQSGRCPWFLQWPFRARECYLYLPQVGKTHPRVQKFR